MLDMGFKPQVDRIVRRFRASGRRCSSPRRSTASVGELAHAYTIERRTLRGALERRGPTATSSIASSRSSPTTRSRHSLSCCRTDRGLALVFVRTQRGADRLVKKLAFDGRSTPSRSTATSARGSASARSTLRVGPGDDARRDGCRRPRTRPRRHHARHQLRPARRALGLRPPRRPHGACRQNGGTGITLVLPDQQADVSRVARLAGHTEQFASGGMTVAPPRRVYSSRRGRSKWGTPAPRRKI